VIARPDPIFPIFLFFIQTSMVYPYQYLLIIFTANAKRTGGETVQLLVLLAL